MRYLSFPLQAYARGNKKKGFWYSFPDMNSQGKKKQQQQQKTVVLD